VSALMAMVFTVLVSPIIIWLYQRRMQAGMNANLGKWPSDTEDDHGSPGHPGDTTPVHDRDARNLDQDEPLLAVIPKAWAEL
jgi:hypothetical protein